jgi:UDP-N-acetyl-2-amino-2-deoxyglucuronate dehydrogenase
VLEEESLTTWKFADEKPEDEEIRKKFAASSSLGGAADPAAISYQGHLHQFEDVIASIKAGKPPAVGGLEARKAVEIILAIYKSAETGREVRLPL